MRNRFPSSRPAGQRATISDVAAAAGVSKATVSKFLGGNKNYYIASETRERIAKAIEDLQFAPNAIAQGLSNRRTDTIGVIVASITNPFYPELIAGVEEALGGSEYTLLLGSTDEQPAKEAALVRSMLQRRVDGLIMAAVTMDDAEVSRLVDTDVDVVLASRGLDTTLADTVVIDNLTGARQAVEHLLGHGHRRIAHLAGPADVVPFRYRIEGYREAMADAGLDGDERLVASGNPAEAMTALLTLPDPPTAVFVANDRMAIEVLEFCAGRGIEVPQELAVVGFDNVWVGRLSGVGLTSVDSKARAVGRKAAEVLAGRIRARHADTVQLPAPPERTVLQPELVIRRSCGCVAGEKDDDAPDRSFF
ncbi:LacI family DNA-binding transcriptional regulator [Paractinoplanes ferrugineus]|uniref:LacI family transcriptional regulator n=1 Tax=Paractinoplanes ferrugineus TaxID=113564 RepID=A0A919MEV0_9ACTN|nr:LacI family DNA-binding transcriptional regulator [Actinoplanes ferrugineus]GIE13143.1 LacI family transcriptional regulator [Actinoplanes ferrugineus]